MVNKPSWDRSSKMQKTSYVQSLIASQGNMDEFREIQASLLPARDDNNDHRHGADAHNDRQRGNYANEDC